MPDVIEASHILLMYDGSKGSENLEDSRSKDDALAQIKDIRSQLDEGAEFSLLAEMYSDCPSAQDGGSLGRFLKGMMVPEFEVAAFALEVGQISDVVETDFGYHLIFRTA